MSTTIARGRAKGIVVRTGLQTEVSHKTNVFCTIYFNNKQNNRLVKLVRLFNLVLNVKLRHQSKENCQNSVFIWSFLLFYYVLWLSLLVLFGKKMLVKW